MWEGCRIQTWQLTSQVEPHRRDYLMTRVFRYKAAAAKWIDLLTLCPYHQVQTQFCQSV